MPVPERIGREPAVPSTAQAGMPVKGRDVVSMGNSMTRGGVTKRRGMMGPEPTGVDT
jgi:hypothetical protein